MRVVTHAVSFSELRQASEKQRESMLGDVVAQARRPANGKVEEIDAQIAEFERIYELPSSEMVEEVSEGRREETDEIASWMMLVNLRDRVRTHQFG